MAVRRLSLRTIAVGAGVVAIGTGIALSNPGGGSGSHKTVPLDEDDDPATGGDDPGTGGDDCPPASALHHSGCGQGGSPEG